MQIKLSELRKIIREELSRKYPAPSDAIKTELRHDGTGILMNHSDVMHKFLSGDVMGIRVEDSNSEIGKGWTNDATTLRFVGRKPSATTRVPVDRDNNPYLRGPDHPDGFDPFNILPYGMKLGVDGVRSMSIGGKDRWKLLGMENADDRSHDSGKRRFIVDLNLYTSSDHYVPDYVVPDAEIEIMQPLVRGQLSPEEMVAFDEEGES
jgi:hypothetical protein